MIKFFLNPFLIFVHIIKFICDLKDKKLLKKVSLEKRLKKHIYLLCTMYLVQSKPIFFNASNDALGLRNLNIFESYEHNYYKK